MASELIGSYLEFKYIVIRPQRRLQERTCPWKSKKTPHIHLLNIGILICTYTCSRQLICTNQYSEGGCVGQLILQQSYTHRTLDMNR